MNIKKAIIIFLGLLIIGFGSGVYAAKEKTDGNITQTVTFSVTLKNSTETTFTLGAQNLYSNTDYGLMLMKISPKDGQKEIDLSPGKEAKICCQACFTTGPGILKYAGLVTKKPETLPFVAKKGLSGKGSECILRSSDGSEVGIYASFVSINEELMRQYKFYYSNSNPMGLATGAIMLDFTPLYPFVLFYTSRNQNKYVLTSKCIQERPLVRFNDTTYGYGNTIVAGVNYCDLSKKDISMNEPTLCIVPAEDANAEKI